MEQLERERRLRWCWSFQEGSAATLLVLWDVRPVIARRLYINSSWFHAQPSACSGRRRRRSPRGQRRVTRYALRFHVWKLVAETTLLPAPSRLHHVVDTSQSSLRRPSLAPVSESSEVAPAVGRRRLRNLPSEAGFPRGSANENTSVLLICRLIYPMTNSRPRGCSSEHCTGNRRLISFEPVPQKARPGANSISAQF